MHVSTNFVIIMVKLVALSISLQPLPSQEDLSPAPVAVSHGASRTEESFENVDDTQLGKLLVIL